MESILINYINSGFLDRYINLEKKEYLIEIIKNIDKKYLYHSDFHGLHHSEKVLLNAYLLGLNEKLDNIDMQIILDAALYHDIGRENDFEDTTHGLITANKLEKIVRNPIYQDKNNLEILRAICDAHSVADKNMENIFYSYEIEEKYKQRYLKLAIILKDADALDRKRFNKTSTAALKDSFLRLDFSKILINLADNINVYYRNKISEKHFNEYLEEHTGLSNITCYHGIGFNFFRLDGILKNGILSNYAKKIKGITNTRNFYGNNNELWISTVHGKGEASKQFIENGISFEVLVPRFIKGTPNRSKAQSEGLPIDSKIYSDEVFVFYEIPIRNIVSININPDFLNMDISTLTYLNGSGNLDSLTNIINEYLNNVRLHCNYFPDAAGVYGLLRQYESAVLKFERLNRIEQEQAQQDFFSLCDQIIQMINNEIQIWIKNAYSIKFNKQDVSVNDVVASILQENNISYKYNCGKFTIEHEIKYNIVK